MIQLLLLIALSVAIGLIAMVGFSIWKHQRHIQSVEVERLMAQWRIQSAVHEAYRRMLREARLNQD